MREVRNWRPEKGGQGASEMHPDSCRDSARSFSRNKLSWVGRPGGIVFRKSLVVGWLRAANVPASLLLLRFTEESATLSRSSQLHRFGSAEQEDHPRVGEDHVRIALQGLEVAARKSMAFLRGDQHAASLCEQVLGFFG